MPADPVGRHPAWRRGLAVALLVLAGLALPIGLVAAWAHPTFFDSRTFSQRAADLLESSAVRTELAEQLTEQLAANGNQQAVNFRPGFQLAIEAAVDTDTFRSIFRTAVRQTHQAVVSGQSEGTALDLSDSLSVISGTLQLPNSAAPGQQDERALGSSVSDVTDSVADSFLWRLDDIVDEIGVFGVGGFLVAAGAAIAVATDRRRTLQRLGMIVVVGGLVISALVLACKWYVSQLVGDPQLAAAVQGAVSRGMADLSALGLWTAGYGLVIAAAARPQGAQRLTPAWAASVLGRWVERRRASTAGTAELGVVAIVAGLLLIQNPSFYLRTGILAAGLWLAYYGASELIGLVRAAAASVPSAEQTRRDRRRNVAVAGGVVVALLVVVSGGLVVTTKRASSKANAVGQERCNGDESLCDLPLNLAVFPATHNSMSAALYPGWLFGEHVRTISAQLNGGVRGLLIDTHYGVPSTARLPGSQTPVIITDRAAELRRPTGEDADPDIARRADELASRAPPRADAKRDLYLCHNYCELGAVPFADALGEIGTFLDSHPDDVVITVIQDATTPADTAAAIEQAGLGERVWTLEPGKPLPTLGEMVRAGRTLLVFAEGGGPGAPPWYHSAYDWFQETPYAFDDEDDMSCAPNRGPETAPLFMVNHWVTESPPNPKRASSVNRAELLEDRLQRCVEERGLLPNVVAVDFAERGNLIETTKELNRRLLDDVQRVRTGGRAPASTTAPPTSQPGAATEPPSSGVTIRPPTLIPSLTGGDPQLFCERVPATLDVVGAWALASIATPASQKGLTDIAYGPGALRVMAASHPVAPEELARQARPTMEHAQAAVQVLRDLGLDQGAIDGVGELTQNELWGTSHPDPVAVRNAALDRIRSAVAGDRLDAAAQAFSGTHPEVAGLFDFGDVPDDVARSSGYECLVEFGG